MKQKSLKLIICLIVLVLNCLNNYAQVIHSTGERTQLDTSLVNIPVLYIKLANKKLIERQSLKETLIYKDLVIEEYKTYIAAQNKIHIDYKNKIEQTDRLNKDLSKRLENQKKTSMILGGVAGASILVIVVTALLN